MKKWLIVALFMFLTPFMVSAEEFEEELHYFNVDPVQPGGEGEKIQVLEFFLYSCPHCFKLEPFVENWIKANPDYIEFVRVPATFKRDFIIMYAKTYYALEQMGKIEEMHNKIFHVLQVEKKTIKTQEAMEVFLEKNGVDIAEYRKQMKSFTVNSKVSRARVMAEKYEISGVPAMTINGKYRVAPMHGDATIAATNFLIDKVHQEKLGVSK